MSHPAHRPELDEATDAVEPELDREVEIAPPRAERNEGATVRKAVTAVLAVVAAVLCVVFLFPEEPAPPPAAPAEAQRAADPAAPAPAAPLGRDAAAGSERVTLPPLELSDDAVRGLVGELTSHPGLARWLAADSLVRRFVAVVDNVAEGVDPRKHLPIQGPPSAFQVTAAAAARPAPESWRRYDPWVELFTSLPPQAAARLHHQLRPLLREAYRDLGYPSGDFDRTLTRAISRLLATPVPAEPPVLVPKVRSWAYADPALEALTPPEKQLLRLGPENQRAVQEHLRRIAAALGIPERDLPAG